MYIITHMLNLIQITMETVRTQVLLTSKQHKKAKHLGVEMDKSLSEIVRDALNQYIQKWEKKSKKRYKKYVIENTIGSIPLRDSGWADTDIIEYQKELRKDNL